MKSICTRSSVVLLWVYGMACAGWAGTEPSGAAPSWAEVTVETLDGGMVRPGDAGDGPFAVMVFITTDCPIANAFQPELRRLGELAERLGGKFTLVHADDSLTVEDLRRHAAEFGIRVPVAMDREHRLVAATGVEVTPEAAVIDRAGVVAYRGRISDLFADYGKKRVEATRHELREAMEALAAGEEVKVAHTKALGCYIPGTGQGR